MIRVLMLPDWRAGNSYQATLSRALEAEGVSTEYPRGTRRVLPLTRIRTQPVSLLHLHWPEAYFPLRGDALDWLRARRFPWDLRLALRGRPLIYTAHNFLPHNRTADAQTYRNYRAVLRQAAAVIVHSANSQAQLAEFEPSAQDRIHVVPHGDLAEDFPHLPPNADARRELRLSNDEPMALVFGRVEPYKGLEALITAWPRLHPTARLWIAGVADSRAYADSLRALAANCPRLTLEFQWLSAEDLATRLAAADVTLFNYLRSFTSGAGCLARSVGKTIVLPAQLQTIDLMEPAPTVFRFQSVDGDLSAVLRQAFSAPADPIGTAAWRRYTAWSVVARRTADIYRQALN